MALAIQRYSYLRSSFPALMSWVITGWFQITGILRVIQWPSSYFQCHFHLWQHANFHNVPSPSAQCAPLLFSFFLACNEFLIVLWMLSEFLLREMFWKPLYMPFQKLGPVCQLWTYGHLDSSDLLFSMAKTVESRSEWQGSLVLCTPEKCCLESS